MVKLKLKICGMRDAENISHVASLRPDYMGFIYFEKSPRYVGEEFRIPTKIEGIKKVGVFVNQPKPLLINLTKNNHLDFVQLHGDESLEYCSELKDNGARIIKVFRLDDDFDFSATKEFESVVDYFLFDTKGRHYGGNAIKFNWDILKKYNQRVPFFLSGGIQLSNMHQLKELRRLNIHAIDVNSGVEDKPGQKSIEKIKEIINHLSV